MARFLFEGTITPLGDGADGCSEDGFVGCLIVAVLLYGAIRVGDSIIDWISRDRSGDSLYAEIATSLDGKPKEATAKLPDGSGSASFILTPKGDSIELITRTSINECTYSMDPIGLVNNEIKLRVIEKAGGCPNFIGNMKGGRELGLSLVPEQYPSMSPVRIRF